MTKYIVKKEFIDSMGALWLKGEKIEDSQMQVKPMLGGLLIRGYLEEVEKNARWRAKELGSYWNVSDEGILLPSVDGHDGWNDSLYEYGNYFKSERTADKVAEALKLFFEILHTDEEQYVDIFEKLAVAESNARDAVLADDRGDE